MPRSSQASTNSTSSPLGNEMRRSSSKRPGLANHAVSWAWTSCPPRTVNRQFGTVASSTASSQKTSTSSRSARSMAVMSSSITLALTRSAWQARVAAALQPRFARRLQCRSWIMAGQASRTMNQGESAMVVTEAELSEQVRGQVVTAGDPDYDEARSVYNGMIDRRPRAIIRCMDVGDVVAAVTFARENALDLSVRGGSHSVPGFGTNDGGVVIDLSPMKGVRVDPSA